MCLYECHISVRLCHNRTDRLGAISACFYTVVGMPINVLLCMLSPLPDLMWEQGLHKTAIARWIHLYHLTHVLQTLLWTSIVNILIGYCWPKHFYCSRCINWSWKHKFCYFGGQIRQCIYRLILKNMLCLMADLICILWGYCHWPKPASNYMCRVTWPCKHRLCCYFGQIRSWFH